MKNLKKLLSVVLVIVLAVGLMATAGAANVADYPDADDVNYTEAVDLFTALGFLQGRDTGDFDPQGLVTREEAAKIITYMLIGSSRADSLTTTVSDFSDVTLGRWSAPFIQYCATQGIINGMGDGTFNPTGNVTGAQFAKMLLCSIGYGVNDEYTGSNWAMKTIADATSLGILSLNVDYAAGATREEVSQYGFNAYTLCNTVVWNSTNQAYQQATDIDGKSAKGTLATQQGVKSDVSEYTTNGVKYYRWTKMGAEITGGYTKENVIGTSTDGTVLSKLTDSNNSKYIATLATSPVYYYNGTAVTAIPLTTNTSKIADATKVGQIHLYNGVVYRVTTPNNASTEIATVVANSVDVTKAKGVIVSFVNANFDSKAETVKIVEKSVSVITGDPRYVSSSDTVTIPALGIVNEPVSKVPGYDTFKDKDVVLWYKDNAGIFHINLATSVTGTVNNYVANTNATVDGTTYKYTGLVDSTTLTDLYGKVQSAAGLADTTVYLDDGGYICYTTQANVSDPSANYLFVTQISTGGVIDNRVRATFSDGTTAVITINETGATPAANHFYRYSVANNLYRLTDVDGPSGAVGFETNQSTMQQSLTAYEFPTGATQTNTIGKGKVDFLEIDSTRSKVLADSKTRFVYRQVPAAPQPEVNYSFVGIANAPDFTADADNEDIYVLYQNGTAVFVYAVGGSFVPTTTTGDWVYILSNNMTVNAGAIKTYTYKALVNGTETTITTTESAGQFSAGAGLYRVTAYDKDGYVTIATPASTLSASQVPLHATNVLDMNVSSGTISVTHNGGSYLGVLNSDVKFYHIDTRSTGSVYSYAMSAAEVNSLNATNYIVDCVVDKDNTITAVYFYMPTTAQLTLPVANVTDPAGNLNVTVKITDLTGTVATYTVTLSGNEYVASPTATNQPSTLTLTNGTWVGAGLDNSAGANTVTTNTGSNVTTIVNSTTGVNETGTFTVDLASSTLAPTLVLVELG